MSAQSIPAQAITTQSALTSANPSPQFGIIAPSLAVETVVIGISQDGRFYFYGDTPQTPGPDVPAIGTPGILNVEIVNRGVEGSRYGTRDYLDVRMQGEMPSLHYLLRLPCQGSADRSGSFTIQHSCRSLLGALQTLDLPGTALKIEPIRGRETTFIQVSLDPLGTQRVSAASIGPDRNDLEIAVNRCRQLLGLPAQFLCPSGDSAEL
jgi:hypothetical protein